MIYTKIKTSDNEIIKLSVDDLDFFCKCPECGKETAVPFLELMDGGNFDTDCKVYCDECSEKAKEYRNKLKNLKADYSHMPLDKLKELYELIFPYTESTFDDLLDDLLNF